MVLTRRHPLAHLSSQPIPARCHLRLQATPVLHHLRIFFIDCFDRGDLSVKPVPAEDQSAEAVYAAWLHRQYGAYQAGLLRLLGDAAVDARTQVRRLPSWVRKLWLPVLLGLAAAAASSADTRRAASRLPLLPPALPPPASRRIHLPSRCAHTATAS